ncbi:MAG: tRNA uridine-5-carboxymethylaminomethyl(34) synthesis GTPase MnmE [Fibrobacter sp.]|nr:tRNA uridine-5-carboxymethylaminomethyl(34) synthesis GTPase MnmE [Fibrobacter sp.]
MEERETIVALATPPGVSALAVIRISGKQAKQIVKKSIKEKEKFEKEKERILGIYGIIDEKGEEIDKVTTIKYLAPKSYTGEEMVEIICHGGIFTINRIVEEIIKNGARCAEKGEFTKRAFLNKKIDIIEAEAINCLINSRNEKESRNALKKINGEHKKVIEKWKNEIIKIIAEVETEIEFGEEIEIENEKEQLKNLEEIEREIDKEIKKRERNQRIEDGIEIIIAGPVNAGKSTLFNKILGFERSITSKHEGTTRDTVSENVIFYGKQIKITDTAGIRKTNNEIEIEGIKRTKKEIEKGNIVIWVTSADEKMSDEERRELININRKIVVINKSDKEIKEKEKEADIGKIQNEYVKISLKEEKSEDVVIKKIKEEIEKILEQYEFTDVVQTKRQDLIIREIKSEIGKVKKHWETKEIASISLNKIIEYFEECLGKIDKEEIYNKVFETFCIGK